MTISFEDFAKLDLRIATILTAEKVEGSDKLLKLQIDLGTEQRQLVARLAGVYAPSELEGRQIVVVANLEPKKLRGVESQGMLLAADAAEGPVLLMPDKEVPPGTRVR